MEAFTRLVATAAPMEAMNVDTDQIIPARYLRYSRAGGYGQYLFRHIRQREDGTERPDFFLNDPAYRDAKILVANANFGCGSSREGAVYALYDYGFRCVIAPSFNDIFYTNSLRNGLLPVRLPAEPVAALRRLVAQAPSTSITIDLMAQAVAVPDQAAIAFTVDPFGRACLLSGKDDIAFTGDYREKIDAFAKRYLAEQPWLKCR